MDSLLDHNLNGVSEHKENLDVFIKMKIENDDTLCDIYFNGKICYLIIGVVDEQTVCGNRGGLVAYWD